MFRVSVYRSHRVHHFCRTHRRLLLLLGLLLGGVVAGCVLFRSYAAGENAVLDALLTVPRAETNVRAAFAALYNACFQIAVLLLVLFFVGLSACGLPVILAVPVFFGLGLGMGEAYYYSNGWKGVLTGVLLLLLPSLFKGAALLMAASESMRMTCIIGARLLEKEPAPSGLYADFRLYRLRFAVFFLIALVGGIAQVLLGMVIGG